MRPRSAAPRSHTAARPPGRPWGGRGAAAACRRWRWLRHRARSARPTRSAGGAGRAKQCNGRGSRLLRVCGAPARTPTNGSRQEDHAATALSLSPWWQPRRTSAQAMEPQVSRQARTSSLTAAERATASAAWQEHRQRGRGASAATCIKHHLRIATIVQAICVPLCRTTQACSKRPRPAAAHLACVRLALVALHLHLDQAAGTRGVPRHCRGGKRGN